VLVDGIPGARNHNGGRIAFGPDGKLYATTGDAGRGELAQDTGSLAGKVLRMNPDGSVPDDNPLPGSLVYSYGHRNPQGLAWQPETGQLFAAEHGPSGEGGLCCRDEVNVIRPGANYGWPIVTGQGGDGRFVDPVAFSGTDTTWAPAGAAFYDGSDLAGWRGDLFFGALRGQHLHRLALGGEDGLTVVEEEELFPGEYGRLRAVAMGPDGHLYVATSNRDGRGRPAPEDDRILRIVAAP
jgi:aldose sugar dehydrogenase